MKLEPVKQSKLPKYAALLAVLSSVPMLTGCGEPEIAGGEAVYIETTISDQEPDAAEPADAGNTDFQNRTAYCSGGGEEP